MAADGQSTEVRREERLLIDGTLVPAAAGATIDNVNPATGTISVDNGLWFGPDVPFGGYEQNGIGREMGRAGFAEHLETASTAAPA